LTTSRRGLATALPLVLALIASPAAAQSAPPAAAPMQPADPALGGMSVADPAFGSRDDGRPALAAPPTPNLTVSGIDSPLGDNEAAFTANTLDYDYKAHQVVAVGDVRMVRQGNRLRADKVVWDRDTDQVHAIGNVAIANPQGDVSYGDDVVLTNAMKDGVVEDMLLVLENGGRMAALKGVRKDGVYTLTRASYTPCDVTTSKGCPKNPLWKITAQRVIYDPAKHRLSYRDARLTFLGIPIVWLPLFSHPDGTGQGGSSGLLVPNITYNKRNGMLYAQPYYRRFAPNRDLTVTPYLYTAVAPMIEAEYRSLGPKGAWRVQGYLTDSTQAANDTTAGSRNVRGYIEANGTFQLGPDWTITASLRAVTDKTFLQRYDLQYDDRLRSVIKAERIDSDSYLSIAGWEFETLVPGAKQSAQPIAIPAIDYRLRVPENLLGGNFTLQANTLGITRLQGEDMQRAFVSAQWEKWLLTPLGQQVTFTALGRGDLYHSSDNADTSTVIYQGQPGWQTRAIAAAAIDVRWPFVGDFLSGTQTLTPRVQVVASPHTKNLAIPNEDSRAIDLDDTNLFAINRFPGYDRWEDGTRVTFGAEYTLDVPHFSLRSQIGESYRLSDRSTILPDGTGLSDKLSDIVARATVRYGSFVSITERVRVDHDTFAVRTNELDATLGSQQTYLEVGYLDLNRHISPTIEDLRDHQEVRLGARLAIGKRWSLYGSTTLDLTGNKDDPTLDSEFNQDVGPIQSRVGIDYSDDCFEFSVNWRRDYTAIGDAQRGTTIQFRLAFKNLGR
jgi:LPS-assembly protein